MNIFKVVGVDLNLICDTHVHTNTIFDMNVGERVQVKNVQHSMVNGRIKPMEYFIVIVVMLKNICHILQ